MRTLTFLCLVLLFSGCQSNNAPGSGTSNNTEPTPDLITTPDAAVPLAIFSFADSALLLPDYSLSPQALFEIETVVPHATEEALNLNINKDLASLMVGDEMPIKVDNLPQTLQSAVATTLYNYRKQNVDSTEVGEMPHAYALTLSYRTEVLLNKHGLLSLATNHYNYAGGAHGNYYAALKTYAVDSSAALSLSDLFPAAAFPALNGMVKAQINHDRLYEPDATIEATENFALTEAGILFNYPPYEIGPYAAGEIEVILPYATLKEMLKPETERLLKMIGDSE